MKEEVKSKKRPTTNLTLSDETFQAIFKKAQAKRMNVYNYLIALIEEDAKR